MDDFPAAIAAGEPFEGSIYDVDASVRDYVDSTFPKQNAYSSVIEVGSPAEQKIEAIFRIMLAQLFFIASRDIMQPGQSAASTVAKLALSSWATYAEYNSIPIIIKTRRRTSGKIY